MNSAGSRWAPRPVGDPVLVGLVAGIVFALHGFDGALTRDLGVFTYGGEHVAAGVPPYAGIFNSVGPLADAVPGLAIWLGHYVGLGPVPAERIAFTVLAATSCALLSVLARDTFRSRLAGFVAPAVFLTFTDYLWLASDGPREKTTMVLLLLAVLVLIGRRRWFAAGVCTALATLTWQPVLAVALAATVVALLAAGSGRLRGVVAYVAGGLVPTAVAVAYYLVNGDFRLAVDGFVIVNAEFTSQPSLGSAPYATVRLLWHGYHASLLVIALGLLAMLLMAAAALVDVVRRQPSRPDGPSATVLLSLGTGALVGSVWTTLVINGPPDLFELLPFAALGVTGAALWLVARLQPDIGAAVLVTVSVLAVVAAAGIAVETRSDGLGRQRADIAAVLAAAPAGSTVLSINAPEVLALSGLTNPSDLQVFDPSIDEFLDHSRPGGMAGYAAWIARIRPTFVVVARGYQLPWPDAVLSQDYRRVGHGPTWDWYLSRSVGAGTDQAVRAANRVAMHGAV